MTLKHKGEEMTTIEREVETAVEETAIVELDYSTGVDELVRKSQAPPTPARKERFGRDPYGLD